MHELVYGLAIWIRPIGELRWAILSAKAAEERFFAVDFLPLCAVVVLVGVGLLALMVVVVMMVVLSMASCCLGSQVDTLNFWVEKVDSLSSLFDWLRKRAPAFDWSKNQRCLLCL